jgi:hypothetical protein
MFRSSFPFSFSPPSDNLLCGPAAFDKPILFGFYYRKTQRNIELYALLLSWPPFTLMRGLSNYVFSRGRHFCSGSPPLSPPGDLRHRCLLLIRHPVMLGGSVAGTFSPSALMVGTLNGGSPPVNQTDESAQIQKTGSEEEKTATGEEKG